VEHKPPETAWLGAPKAAEGCRSQERVFLDEEESDHPTDYQTVKRVPSSGSTNSHQTVWKRVICRCTLPNQTTRSLKIGRKPFRLRRRGKRYFCYVPHEGVNPRQGVV
jgi:hypothetical protein